MSINTVTHINLRGDARAALEFYQSVFGGNLAVVTYEDAHNVQNPDEADQVMWGEVVSEDGFHVMAYDVPSATAFNPGEIAYFVSVRGTPTRSPPTGRSSAPRARSRRRWRPPVSRRSTAWSPTSSVSSGSSTSPSNTTRPSPVKNRARGPRPRARSLFRGTHHPTAAQIATRRLSNTQKRQRAARNAISSLDARPSTPNETPPKADHPTAKRELARTRLSRIRSLKGWRRP